MNARNQATGGSWTAINGDCVVFARDLPRASIDFSVYSPPFANLFIYSDSVADMGNCANDAEFFDQYRYLIREKLRVTKPGRLTAVHCSDLPIKKSVEGYIGLNPFSDKVVREHLDAGWIFHCRIVVWRDPVVEMTRTKALGLLHKQLKKDSAMSRVGMPDYVLVFRAPGDNAAPIAHAHEDLPVPIWQEWASPVWMDIRQTNVLNVRAARDPDQEKHICPLQLDLIERALVLWSNPGDVVFSPFMGIGSEGFVSVKTGRRFVGTELNETYWRQAVQNLKDAEAEASRPNMLTDAGAA